MAANILYYHGPDGKYHAMANRTDWRFGLVFGSKTAMRRAFNPQFKLKSVKICRKRHPGYAKHHYCVIVGAHRANGAHECGACGHSWSG